MLRYGLTQYKSSSPLTPPSSATSNESMESLNDGLKRKSLTPQRKHHKLLKDGSEVWSSDVEKIFVDGLHKYWESPWATYSRGRSRWRNQFLVEHLKKSGIERSKKQVASHIQVLRNMWRGEPEFHLVAGGEELFQENGLLASPKSIAGTGSPEPTPSTSLDTPDWRHSWSSIESASSMAEVSSPEQLPIDIFPSSSGPRLGSAGPMPRNASPRIQRPATFPADATGSGFSTITPATARTHSRAAVKLEPLAMEPTLFNLPQGSLHDTPEFAYVPPPNRLCGINFWTNALALATIDVDSLTTRQSGSNHTLSPSRILLRFNVNISPNTPPAMQGIDGMVSFATPWTTSAKCHTKKWAGKACVSHEIGHFEQQRLPGGSSSSASSMVFAGLPQSELSRCRWSDPTVQTITQQIVVDREVLAVIIYTLVRDPAAGGMPSTELVGFHKYPWQTPSSQPLASPSISPVSPSLFPNTRGAAAVSQMPLFARPLSGGEDAPLPSTLDFSHTPAMGAPNPTFRNPSRLFQ